MKQENIEKFMEMINDQYTKNHNRHMDLIRRYTENLVSFETYKILEKEYTVKSETLKQVIDSFLYYKNEYNQ